MNKEKENEVNKRKVYEFQGYEFYDMSDFERFMEGWLVGFDNGYNTGYHSCLMILKDIIKNITNEQIKEIKEKWNEQYIKFREFYGGINIRGRKMHMDS